MLKKAIFLDRDGVINHEIGEWVYRLEDFVINNDVVESLRLLQEKGYIFIVVTNQSGIAKGVYRHEDVNTLHRYLENYFHEAGIQLAEIYYCPHHDDTGRCLCRKPNSMMIEKAIAKFEIDTNRSYLIGDKDRDVAAGEKAGVKGILVKPDASILEIARSL